MKEYFIKLIKQKKEQAEAIRKKVEAAADVNEVRSLTAQMNAVQDEIREAQIQLDKLEAKEHEPAESRSLNPLASYGTHSSIGDDQEQKRNLAFANFVTRGRPIPAELRDTTTTTDTSAVIPVHLSTEIIENLEAVGMILPLVTKTNYPAGQRIPIDSVKPVASWVGEGQGSDKQKKSALTSITFGAYKLRCEIAMTQEVTVQTLPAFERLFIKQVSEAMTKAIESKILSDDDGTSGNPTGIFYNPNESSEPDQAVEIEDHILDYQVLIDAEAKLPQQYENGAKWIMTKKTFMEFFGMVDSNGQPIARMDTGITGKPVRVLLGREVILCGEYMQSFSKTVEKDTIIACLFNLSDYVLNTSYDLGIQSKIDWDTEDHLTKAVMSVDGKVVDRHSLVKIVQKASG